MTGVAGVYPELCEGTTTGTNRSQYPGREPLSSLAYARDKLGRLREHPVSSFRSVALHYIQGKLRDH